MSEQTQSETSNEFTPITSQEEFDKILGQRLQRERSKYSDYQELQEKAAKFDAAEEAAKTELEKIAQRAEKAEKELQQLKQAAQLTEWRTQVSSETGVPADVLAGSTLEELQAHAERLKTLITSAEPAAPKATGFLPTEGEKPAIALNSDSLVDKVLDTVGV